MSSVLPRLLAVAVLPCCVQFAAPLMAAPLDAALEESERLSEEAASSQARIEQLDDATRQMLTDYRSAVQQAEALKAYNAQMRELTAAQQKELEGYERQLQGIERTQEAVTPQMSRMVEVLGQFIERICRSCRTSGPTVWHSSRSCCHVPMSAWRKSTVAFSRRIRSRAITAAPSRPGAASCRSRAVRAVSSFCAWAA